MLSQYINSAHAANLNNEFDKAIGWCNAAIALAPELPEAWYNLGLAHKGLGQKDQAVDALLRAGKLTIGSADAQNSIGYQLLELGDLVSAEGYLRQSLKLNPRYAFALSNLGMLFERQQLFQAAEDSFRKALKLQPDLVPLYINLGGILNAQGKFQEAIPACRKAVEFLPTSAKAWNNLGSALSGTKQYEAAIECYERCLKLEPAMPFVPGHLVLDQLNLCSWQAYEATSAALINSLSTGHKVVAPFQALAVTADPSLQMRAAEIYVSDNFSRPRMEYHPLLKKDGQKIRVAYYSADFHNHPVALLLMGLLKAHDKQRFEIIGVDLGTTRKRDDVHHQVKQHCDVFIEMGGSSDDEILRVSREHRFDIAIDLNGHTGESHTGIFAAGVAPIQVNYLGYTGTMGADFMDYIVADEVTIPQSLQEHYRERIVRLPDCYFPPNQYDPIADKTFKREECGLPEQGTVFGCFNNSYKLTPDVFGSWMRILKQTNGSVLWLSGMQEIARENLRKEAGKHGLDPMRLVFAERVPSRSEHLARHRLMDLFLDTLPYNAHTTASDALSVGVPVLTCPGGAFASRVAASMVRSLGLDELVANSLTEYETTAIALAKDTTTLAGIKSRLAKNLLTSSLSDISRYTKHLELAYGIMYERLQSGLLPTHFDVKAQDH